MNCFPEDGQHARLPKDTVPGGRGPTRAGIYDLGSRLAAVDRPWWPVLIVCLLTFACLTKRLIEGWDDFSWYTAEHVAAKVKEVTPPKAVLLADELTYFITRHEPPSGLELRDSHKLDFPPAVAREYHVVSQKELDRMIKANFFDIIEIADDDERVEKLSLKKMYLHSAEVEDMDILWGKK